MEGDSGNGMWDRLPGAAGGSARNGGKADEWHAIVPVPANAPSAPLGHPGKGRPSVIFTYRSAGGELLGLVCRFEDPIAGKVYLPLTFCRHGGGKSNAWRWKSWDGARPLYGLDRLAARPGAPVIVCEGEKAADAAARLLPDHVAVTSPNGSKSASKASWSALAGRSVVIWPDADEPGSAYAKDVIRALSAAPAASIAVMTPPAEAKSGWDAADAEAEGWDSGRTLDLVRAARPEARPDKEKSGERRSPGARDGLLSLAEGAELWHTPDMEPWASIPINGHMENWPINEAYFRRWLIGRYYGRHGAAPGDQAIKEAISTLDARAVHGGPEYSAFLRVAATGDERWLDLADADWRAVCVTSAGWEIVDRPKVKFRRVAGMMALPEPSEEGNINDLREILNVATEGDFKTTVGWLVASLNPKVACPVLAVSGEQGTAKSSTSSMLRGLVDPNDVPLRAGPKDEHDFAISAYNSHVVALDNLSVVPDWLSDALCRLSTGGGFATRKLYSSNDETRIKLRGPVLLNGIQTLAQRPDLADRIIALRLPPILDERRITDEEFWAKVERRRPSILGALLDAVSTGLRNWHETKLPKSPRMADFAKFMTAAEPGLEWYAGSFMDAYEFNRSNALEKTIDASPVGDAVRALAAERDFEGTATALLAELETRVPEVTRKSRSWPSVFTLRNRLTPHQATLRRLGILVELDVRGGGRDNPNLITIRMPNRPPPSVGPTNPNVA